MTRSRTITNPNEYTSIPFPLKALKLILKDVQIVKQGEKGKTAGPSASAGSDIEEDDGVSNAVHHSSQLCIQLSWRLALRVE